MLSSYSQVNITLKTGAFAKGTYDNPCSSSCWEGMRAVQHLESDQWTSVESGSEPGSQGSAGQCLAPGQLAERRDLEADLTPDWMVGSVKRSSDSESDATELHAITCMHIFFLPRLFTCFKFVELSNTRYPLMIQNDLISLHSTTLWTTNIFMDIIILFDFL